MTIHLLYNNKIRLTLPLENNSGKKNIYNLQVMRLSIIPWAEFFNVSGFEACTIQAVNNVFYFLGIKVFYGAQNVGGLPYKRSRRSR